MSSWSWLLIAGAVFTLVYVILKIREHQLEINDSIFWFCFAVLLVILAAFPHLSYFVSSVFGVISPINFVLVVVIAVLIYHELSLSSKLAHLRRQVVALAQRIALDEKTEKTDEDE